MSFPRHVGQLPLYYNYKNTGRPGPKKEVFWSHFQDEKNSPLYPFGYGLSYTSFEYSNVSVANTYGTDKTVTVSVTLTNTGNYEGKEVAQLYIRDHFASITRPVRELKGFELVNLAPKESKTIRFTLTDKELGFYNNQGDFLVEPGDFSAFVGGSSAADLKTEFTIE